VLFFAVEDDPMVYDNQAVERYLYGGIDRMRANIAVSEAAYAEASKRAATNCSRASVPCITTLLAANGHTSEEAAQIVQVAQRSWSKTPD
jgi:hypothetical protein